MAEAKKRGRGRPALTDEERRQRRQALVVAAYELFQRDGYPATGVAEITAHAGVGFGSFYRCFENKRQLLDAVVDHGVETLLGSIFLDLPEPTTVAEFDAQTRALLARTIGIALDQPDLLRVITVDLIGIDDELRLRWFGLVEQAVVMVRLYLERALALGFVRADLDTEAFARMIVGAFLAVAVPAAGGTLTRDYGERYVESLMALVGAATNANAPTRHPDGSVGA